MGASSLSSSLDAGSVPDHHNLPSDSHSDVFLSASSSLTSHPLNIGDGQVAGSPSNTSIPSSSPSLSSSPSSPRKDGRVSKDSGGVNRAHRDSESSSKPDDLWSISFEQFLASILTEEALVQYFEQMYSVSEAVQKMRNRRLATRQTSVN